VNRETETSERIVKYVRHEFHGDDEPCEGPLLHLVYDIPNLDALGVFPPLHILNGKLSSGGGDGGMSPGASWEPFIITATEYQLLTDRIRTTPLDAIRPYARYADVPFVFDPRFDHIQDRYAWMSAVCDEHRSRNDRNT
jgi:hypothetical protein